MKSNQSSPGQSGQRQVLRAPETRIFMFRPVAARSLWLRSRAIRWSPFPIPLVPARHGADLIASFMQSANRQFLAPVFYKSSPAFADLLVSMGQSRCQISVEAEVDLAEFSLEGSGKRELRRKLRDAEKAGVETACIAAGQADYADFSRISDAWQSAKTDEKGFSIGPAALPYSALPPDRGGARCRAPRRVRHTVAGRAER